MSQAEDEQRFDFGDLPEAEEQRIPPKRLETAEELVARVEAVHAVASRVRNRRRQVEHAADELVAAFPLDDLAPGHPDDSTFGDAREASPAAELRPLRLSDPAQVAAGVIGEPVPTMVSEGSDLGGEFTAPEADGTLTIAAFYERVRDALIGAFPDEVWVTGEIRGFRESRGHRFLELGDVGAESAGGRSAQQQLEVVCWSRDWPPIGRQLADAGVDLEVGRVVRVRGKVSVWEGASKLRFTLTALDVEALLGGIAAARRRLLLVLEKEGLLEKNRQHAIPLVPLRIGVITSPGSEAHRDFVGRLDRSGIAFELNLEPSLVQGSDAPGQLVAALSKMVEFGPELVVVVRGGGARGDLAAFDAESVVRAIANAPFPVWVGIGHTGDRSVVDEVAHSAFITPTACGEAVVGRVETFWDAVEHRARDLVGVVRNRLEMLADRLAAVEVDLGRSARHQVERRAGELVHARALSIRAVASRLGGEADRTGQRSKDLRGVARRALTGVAADLDRRTQVLRALDPRRQFE
ncbi:MAG TPA: exodeoxyribonuclease VII large subunit, partial [Acidimicrobiales bacterium]|nr:exodeoxyribonuclease VII large subunit [Acidimicrobiales bacterium]